MLWTLRYLSLSQIYYRLVRRFRVRWWRLAGAKASYTETNSGIRLFTIFAGVHELSMHSDRWQREVQTATKTFENLKKKSFNFLNVKHQFKESINWNSKALSQLWIYNLHYFHYLQPLNVLRALGRAEESYAVAKDLMLSWIEANDELKRDGWHPYTISLRVVNWIQTAQSFQNELEGDVAFKSKLLSSIYFQVENLSKNLEFDVRGNHLLENLRALIWAGCFFTGPESGRWFDRGMLLLEREVLEQVLPDGGHFERSPGYHLVVLKDLIEIGCCLRQAKRLVPDWLLNAISRMLAFIDTTFGPDYAIPILKDTAIDAAPSVQEVCSAGALLLVDQNYKFHESVSFYTFLLFGEAGERQFHQWSRTRRASKQHYLQDSGYIVIATPDHKDHFLLDVGKPCPDYLPAHAHADLLSFELWVGGSKWLCDSGVYCYAPGKWRDYFRSTRAHNTVEVNSRNQSDVYGSFRVGKRARPFGVRLEELKGGIFAGQGAHDGYETQEGVIHRRIVLNFPEKYWAIIDILGGVATAEGRSFFHFDPNVMVNQLNENSYFLEKGDQLLFLSIYGQVSGTIVRGQENPRLQGWSSDRFGDISPNSCLEITWKNNLPATNGVIFSKGSPAFFQTLTVSEERLQFSIRFNDQVYNGELLLAS